MKTTNISLIEKAKTFSLISLGLIMSSCSSLLQDTGSYSDGIYGDANDAPVASSKSKQKEKPSDNSQNSYAAYFKSLQTDAENDDVFTDVDSYSGNSEGNNYASWGSSAETTSINIYPNNSWGLYMGYGYPYSGVSIGYGYGYPYYGYSNPYYGYGYPYYGYSYPYYGYGYGYPYHGHGHGHGYPYYPYNGYTSPIYSSKTYTYNTGRRGSNYSGVYGKDKVYSKDNSNFKSTGRRSSSGTEYGRSNSNNYGNNSEAYKASGRRSSTTTPNYSYPNNSGRNQSPSYTPSPSTRPSTPSYSGSSGRASSSGSYGGSSGGSSSGRSSGRR